MSEEEALKRLKEALLNFNVEATRKAVEEAVGQGVAPLKALKALTNTAKEIGQKYAALEIFLVDLMMAGDALKAGVEFLTSRIPKEKISKAGVVLIGTVKGDIHDIGKAMVIAMLTAAGFEVHDLGKDVAVSAFAEEAEKVKPDIVAASALMTTTIPLLKDLVDYFRETGIREKYKIIVGGGAVTRQYAEEIGADGYGEDAVEAAAVAKKVLAES